MKLIRTGKGVVRNSLLLTAAIAAVSLIYWWPGYGKQAKSLPGSFGLSSTVSELTGGQALSPSFSKVTSAKPLPSLPMPKHPYQNNFGMAGAHADSYNSGVVPLPGPVSADVVVSSRMMSGLFSGCSTQNFTNEGQLVAVCVGLHGTSLVLLDPSDLTILAREPLPKMAGWYFRLDPEGKVWVPASDFTLRRYRIEKSTGSYRWVLEKSIDIGLAVPEEQRGLKSFPMDLVFDWQGNLWFVVFEPAIVGYIEANTGKLYTQRLQGEVVENGLGASEHGVFFVTDRHFYYFNADEGIIESSRFPYDRGGSIKALSRGSGSTPVVFASGKLVAFGDNSDPRPNALVYRLDNVPDEERLVCKVPMFEPGLSALENSFIAYDHSIIVENNFEFSVFGDSSGGQPGIARIDVAKDFSNCELVWENRTVASGSGAKLSTGNGLIYQYSLEVNTGAVNAWYFTAVDFHTGKLLWKQYAGSGKQWDNAMLTVTVGPNGTLVVGTFGGLIAVRDRVR